MLGSITQTSAHHQTITTPIPRTLFIQEATCNDDLTVTLLFNDQTQRIVNIGDFIRQHPHPQYNKYLIPKNFRKMRLEDGNILWGKNGDLEFHIEDLYTGNL